MTPDHYFTAQPASDADLGEVNVELAGESRTIFTARGVFSGAHLDMGTSVLLRSVDRIDAAEGGHVLDLGCGWGPIALTMGLELAQDGRDDATVWAVDVNERALDLVARNAQRLGLSTVRPSLPGLVPEGIEFDAIWSNPPIRVGKAALHELLLQWLPLLRLGAAASLVVGKNLGADSLQTWLAQQFPVASSPGGGSAGTTPTPMQASVRRTETAKGFRVIEVTRIA